MTGDEIWIAQGTYKPTSGTSRTASFVLKNGVHLVGGFSGGESQISQRDVLLHRTILSGAIGGSSTADNSFHVVTAPALANLTILDGLTIQDGNANRAGPQGETVGPAIFSNSSLLTCSSCVIRNNQSTASGAAYSNSAVATRRLTLFQCLIVGNQTGAAVSMQGLGGGTISQCTITQNAGGVTFVGAPSSPSLVANSIIYFNGSGAESDQFLASSPPTMVGSLIQGWDNVNPSSTSVFAFDPVFLDRLGSDGVAGTDDDNLHLRGDSPAIDRGSTSFIGVADALDVDDDGATNELYPLDLDGNARRIDDPLVLNTGAGAAPHTDCGAFEYARRRTILVNHAATGANNGTNWADAYTDLQSALAELGDPVNGGAGEIWVAQGTYKPTSGTDQTASFKPTPSVILLGGFTGSELTRKARDWRAHPTILSGDLGPAGPAGNSFHVVRCFATSPIVPYVDGFVIRDGVCPANEGGGGIRFEAQSDVLFGNCLVTGNSGTGKGAAVEFSGTGASPGGGIIYSAIVGNAASGSGVGGVSFDHRGGALIRCAIAGNTSTSSSLPAGIHAVAGTQGGIFLVGVDVFDNRSSGVANLAAQFGNNGASVNLNASGLQGFVGSIPGVSLNNVFAVDGSGGVVDANGADGVYGTADDNLTPSVCSPLIDTGSAFAPLFDAFDLDEDGQGSDQWPYDFYLGQGVLDLPSGVPGLVDSTDAGPVERQTGGGSPDLDGSGTVDAADLGLLLGAWGTLDSPFELTGDCVISAADLAVLLGAWGN